MLRLVNSVFVSSSGVETLRVFARRCTGLLDAPAHLGRADAAGGRVRLQQRWYADLAMGAPPGDLEDDVRAALAAGGVAALDPLLVDKTLNLEQ